MGARLASARLTYRRVRDWDRRVSARIIDRLFPLPSDEVMESLAEIAMWVTVIAIFVGSLVFARILF